MSILAGFMVPHPPMIVPQIGRGSEKQITATINAYEKVSGEIASFKPDTIIISSPHALMYGDYFHISPGKKESGSFSRFGVNEVSFNEEYDTELVDEIAALARKADFPAGTEGKRDYGLDHGTMVPLYFIRQKYNEGKIVRVGLSALSLVEHYKLGMMIKEAVEKLGRRAVFVASGDLSHKLQDYGPYGFADEGPEYDRRIMDVCSRAAFGELFDFDESFCEKAAECGHRSFVMMAGAFDGINVTAEKLSHEDVTGVGYGICTFRPGEESEKRKFLERYLKREEEKKLSREGSEDPFVTLARQSVESFVRYGKKLELPKGLPKELTDSRAGAFVSIHKHGRLRGCIGTIGPVQPSLGEEIIRNAISASTEDPRFSPIKADELRYLEINVDVLGKPEKIESEAELDVKRYGVIVTSGMKRGLLLPDLDGVDTVAAQIDIAKRKAGIREGEKIYLERFEVVRHR